MWLVVPDRVDRQMAKCNPRPVDSKRNGPGLNCAMVHVDAWRMQTSTEGSLCRTHCSSRPAVLAGHLQSLGAPIKSIIFKHLEPHTAQCCGTLGRCFCGSRVIVAEHWAARLFFSCMAWLHEIDKSLQDRQLHMLLLLLLLLLLLSLMPCLVWTP